MNAKLNLTPFNNVFFTNLAQKSKQKGAMWHIAPFNNVFFYQSITKIKAKRCYVEHSTFLLQIIIFKAPKQKGAMCILPYLDCLATRYKID